MADWLNRLTRRISSSGGIFMFLRAQLSAQIATVVDFGLTLILAEIFAVYYVYASFSGAFAGGVVNCYINYSWVFKSRQCNRMRVMLKYLLVWTGSIALNTYGTYGLTELFGHSFILPKIVVAIGVAILWNYNMHRLFVYRNIHIKKSA